MNRTREKVKRRNGTRAALNGVADKFVLYQESVQNAEFEVKFIQRVFQRARGRGALKLREDFCGTAILCCEWVRRVDGGRAVGVDLDAGTLEYARDVNVAALGRKADRVQLVRKNVLDVDHGRPDVVAAYNFSYFVFKTREELLRYFERVRRTLASDGVFVLDIYGGPEAQAIQEESTEHDGWEYVWDQARYNPITGELLCYIHFDFPDGTRMERAFTYDWRLWSLPEVTDALVEVGFEPPEVYWEGTDHATGGGNGVFRRSRRGDNSLSWVAYIVAKK